LLAQKKETKKSASDSMPNFYLTSTSCINESAGIRVTPTASMQGRCFVLKPAQEGAGFFAVMGSSHRNIPLVEKEARGIFAMAGP
jgi:hypothetical protein